MAARHLHHFEYTPTVYLPKSSSKDLLQRLVKQCQNLNIPILKDVDAFQAELAKSDVILDAIFGFSFQPPLRKPFDQVLKAITGVSKKVPIVSVDIPSGWSVTDGPQPLWTEEDDKGGREMVETFEPEVLVSLTAPKEGVKEFKGRHWLGGRFVPEYVLRSFPLFPLSEKETRDGLMSMVVNWQRSTNLIFHLTKGLIKSSSFLVIIESGTGSCRYSESVEHAKVILV